MSREKQIEEMAECCPYFWNGACTLDVTHPTDCDLMCDVFGLMTNLVNAGYRKQREGKWIKATPYSQEYCNQCGLTPKTIFGKLPPFCPNCGASMKGGVNDDK